MKKKIIITASVVCLALFGLAMAAGGPGFGHHRTPEEKIAYLKSKISETLELTEHQQTTLDRIADEVIAERDKWADDRAAFKSNVVDMLQKEHVDAQELQILFETRKPAIEYVMHMAAEKLAEFHGVLTPEQRETLITKMENHNGRRCRLFR